jgi:CheY-like chemotaxis protein
MSWFTRIPSALVTVALCLLLPGLAEGQDPFAPEEPAAGAGAPPPVPDVGSIQNPAVRAAYELPRREPGDYLRAVLNLLDLGEPQLAAAVFRELEGLNLNDEQRAALVSRFGTAALLRLGQAEEALGPGGRVFAEATIAAASDAARAPERVAQLVAALGNPAEQRAAIASLSTLGEVAVLASLEVLANPQAPAEQRRGARTVLVQMDPASRGPLLAAIDSSQPELQGEAATLLAHLGVAQAAPLLATSAVQQVDSAVGAAYQSLTGQSPSVSSAEGLLRRSLDNLRGGVPPFELGGDGLIAIWLWDDARQAPVKVSVNPDDAIVLHTARLSQRLSSLRPDQSRYRVEGSAWTIEANAILTFVGAPPLAGEARLDDMTAGELDQLLAGALNRGQSAPAIAALAEFARRKDPGVLYTGDGRPSPMAAALSAHHPRVRYAALEAIVAIDPTRPFPGASRVAPAMVRILTATGAPHVLAISPRIDAATTWGAGLSAQGFRAHVAATGEEALAMAKRFADIELVLVDMSIDSPGVREVVFQLRRDFGTALVPIGLFGREEQLPIGARIEQEHERVIAYPRPHSDEALLATANELSQLLPRDWPAADERLAARRQVLQWMGHFLTQERDFYRLRAFTDEIAQAAPGPSATPEAWQLLADLGTHASQIALVEAAGATVYPVEARQGAAAAFARSVERFGLLLTTDEIVHQYDTYNASGGQPAETQQILGNLLDTIESVRKSRQPARVEP